MVVTGCPRHEEPDEVMPVQKQQMELSMIGRGEHGGMERERRHRMWSGVRSSRAAGGGAGERETSVVY